jgi:hypothetical protein
MFGSLVDYIERFNETEDGCPNTNLQKHENDTEHAEDGRKEE